MYDVEKFEELAEKIISKREDGYAFVILHGPSSCGKSLSVNIARNKMKCIDESYCLYGCTSREDALIRISQVLSTDRDIINIFSTCNRALAEQLEALSLPVVYLTDK